MAGSKTRFGFAGGSEPPNPEDPQSARTVFGHDIHLQIPPGFVPPRPPGSPTPLPPAPPRWTPAAPVPTPIAEQESTSPIPARSPSRPHQSRLARFLGRWTRSGRFVPGSRMDLDADEDLEVPRDTTGRNLLLVLVVAGLAFGLTFAVVKLRQRYAAPAPEPPAEAVVAPQAQAAPPPAPSVAAPVPPPAPAAASPATESPPAPHPAPAAAPPSPVAARGLGAAAPVPGAKGPGAAAPAAIPRRSERGGHYMAEPPAHLKGELLPLGP